MRLRTKVATTIGALGLAAAAFYAPAASADRVGFSLSLGGPGYSVNLGNYGYGYYDYWRPAPVVVAPYAPYYAPRPVVVPPPVVYRPYPVYRSYDRWDRRHDRWDRRHDRWDRRYDRWDRAHDRRDHRRRES